MSHRYESAKTLLVLILILGAVIVWPWLNAKSVANCEAINEGRSQGVIRARALRESLELNAQAWEKLGFPAKASRARYQETLVKNLPVRNC